MLKRFVFEWKRSAPFFAVLCVSASLTWIWMRVQLGDDALTVLPYLLFGLSFACAALFASVAFVVYDIHRELSHPEGLLTFLIPVAPWKILLAKWLNLIVSFGLSFLLFNVVTTLFPVPWLTVAERARMMFAGFAQSMGAGVNTLATQMTGMSLLGVMLFVFRWSLVLFVGDWAMTLTEAWATRRQWRHGKVLLRVFFLIAMLVLLDHVQGLLFTRFPLMLTDAGALAMPRGEVSVELTYFYESRLYVDGPNGFYSGLPVLAFATTPLACLFFLWRSDAHWRQIDR